MDEGWFLSPLAPRLTDNVVFLTNARAASYPESILGLIKANRLAKIVGSPTAGANGNITAIQLPGGYRTFFTGMRVINRDGSAHHNQGVIPDIIVRRTPNGIREGRDEELEKGLEVLRASIEQSGA